MYWIYILFSVFYLLIFQNWIGAFLVMGLLGFLLYSYQKGKRMIQYIDISINKHKHVYQQGDRYQFVIEVPKQKIFESRELELDIQYTSAIRRDMTVVREVLLLRRRHDGKVQIEYPLDICDCIDVEINEFCIRDLTGCLKFRKKIDFYEKIIVLPKEYGIEYGDISGSLEEYGNVRLSGGKDVVTNPNPVLYLDLNTFHKEDDPDIRREYLPMFYSISHVLLREGCSHSLLAGDQIFKIDGWEDYLPVFLRIYDLISYPVAPPSKEQWNQVTHVITTIGGLPVPDYGGKIVALILDEDHIDHVYPRTEYIRARNMEEDMFQISL